MAQQGMSVFARGWFVICFSDELPKGTTRALHYFDRDMVAFRGEDGAVRVLDAHCPHLGAHLAIGGKVVGNDIQCPFHAWKYCGDTGKCNEIPYAKKIPERAKVGTWPVRELNGVVMIHHDPLGRPPSFEIPVIPEYGTDEWLPWTRSAYKIRTQPREVVENLADKAHFASVHNTEIETFAFEVNGHTATQTTRSKALLPNGGVDVFESSTTYHGPAYLLMRMNGALQNYMLFAHTPIDDNNLDLRLAVTLKIVGSRSKTEGYVKGYIDNLKAGFEDDIRIWENKVYREQPLISDADGPIGALRRWYKQFYELPA